MLAWAKLIPLRDWIAAIVLIAILLFILFWNAHERNIGEAKCKAAQVRVQTAAQATIDANWKESNEKIQAAYNANTYAPINYHAPANCGSVPADVRLRVNAAGKTRKR